MSFFSNNQQMFLKNECSFNLLNNFDVIVCWSNVKIV